MQSLTLYICFWPLQALSVISWPHTLYSTPVRVSLGSTGKNGEGAGEDASISNIMGDRLEGEGKGLTREDVLSGDRLGDPAPALASTSPPSSRSS